MPIAFVGSTRRASLLGENPEAGNLLYKRLHRVLLAVPQANRPSVQIDANELAALLTGVPKEDCKKLDA